MDLRLKRHIASWFLLAVFLPTIIITSLHNHSNDAAGASNHIECVHNHCGGHMGQQSHTIHNCVLCQFLTLSFIAPFIAVSISFIRYSSPIVCGEEVYLPQDNNYFVGLRAPPSV